MNGLPGLAAIRGFPWQVRCPDVQRQIVLGIERNRNHRAQLVIVEGGTARVVTDAEIKDMSFLASNIYLDGDTLKLYGSRWINADPHCCPSKKATLEYNLKTHRHKFINTGDNKT